MSAAVSTVGTPVAINNASGASGTLTDSGGSNNAVVLAVSWASVTAHTATATYGDTPVSMTSIGVSTNSNVNGAAVTGKTQYFGLVAPATGNQDWAVTFSGSGNFGSCVPIFLTGVDQSSPFDGVLTNSALQSGANVDDTLTVTSAAGNLVFSGAFMENNIGGQTITGNKTEDLNLDHIGGGSGSTGYFGFAQHAAGASTVAMKVHSDQTPQFATIAFNVNAATSAGEPTTATLTGPSTGITGNDSTDFTVTLDAPATVTSGTITFTPAGTVGTVTFTPSTIAITLGNDTGTFTANADTDGTHVISMTDDGSLTDTDTVNYVTSAAPSGVIGSVFRSAVISGA